MWETTEVVLQAIRCGPSCSQACIDVHQLHISEMNSSCSLKSGWAHGLTGDAAFFHQSFTAGRAWQDTLGVLPAFEHECGCADVPTNYHSLCCSTASAEASVWHGWGTCWQIRGFLFLSSFVLHWKTKAEKDSFSQSIIHSIFFK